MFHGLNIALAGILGGADVPALVRNAEVSFDRPAETYNPGQTTINLFLYDLCENTELRNSEPLPQRGDGVMMFRMPPLRVMCSYLVTAWTGADLTGEAATLKHHELLGEVLRVFSALPSLPAQWLMGSLGSQPYPVPLSTLRTELTRNPAEFWAALGGKLRPAFTLAATVALTSNTAPVTAHVVSSKKIELHGTEPIFQIGGTVRATAGGSPVEEVELTLDSLGLQVHSNAAGQFRFSGVPGGSYQLQARKQGYVTTRIQVRVPGASPTAFDLQLST